ncbi:MAG: radical SAM protein [Oscillospiraceae bacterium]|nr:radical SAM protein [Oscillospiraceae bacterium]
MRLRLYNRASPIHTLGPFNRYGIWVQGCSRRCDGCITPEGQPLDGGYEMEVEELCREILREPGLEGITISGGEPYLQAEALAELIEMLRLSADLGVIVYTGNLYEQIREERLTGLCDAIIDGPYMKDRDDNKSLRGSDNQRLILLTDRYKGLIPFGTINRQTEKFVSSEGFTALVGVPPKCTEEERQWQMEVSLIE